MKSILIVLLALSFLNACNSQVTNKGTTNTTGDTTITPIKVSVNANGNLKNIHLLNQSSDSLWYYVGMEMWIDNEWGEIILDVNPKAPEKGAILKKIAPSKDTIYKCALMQILPPFYKIDTGRYRFKINYGSSPGNVIKEMQTVEFKLNK